MRILEPGGVEEILMINRSVLAEPVEICANFAVDVHFRGGV
jgi:hypothetical protein